MTKITFYELEQKLCKLCEDEGFKVVDSIYTGKGLRDKVYLYKILVDGEQ